MSEELSDWARELDVCDGYLVILGSPLEQGNHRVFGPYPDRDALKVADDLSLACDEPVSIVRFHRSQDAAGWASLGPGRHGRPRRNGARHQAPRER